MKIVIGSDHNGVELKAAIGRHLADAGHAVDDIGPEDARSVDYPDYAIAAATMVSDGRADRGILICGSGIGMSIAANKVHGVRAAVCRDAESAVLTRQHNDANVLALGGWQGEVDDIMKIVDGFINTEFEGGRHARRVDKITAFEDGER